MSNAYEVLGVTREAPVEEIRQAWRAIARVCHPDRCPDDPEAEDRFKAAAAAWEVLSDPGRRAAHDMDLRVAEGGCAICGRPVTSGRRTCLLCALQAKIHAREEIRPPRSAEPPPPPGDEPGGRPSPAPGPQAPPPLEEVYDSRRGMRPDDLLEVLYIENALGRAAREARREHLDSAGRKVVIEFDPGIRVKVDANTLKTLRQAQRTLTLAEQTLGYLRKWLK